MLPLPTGLAFRGMRPPFGFPQPFVALPVGFLAPVVMGRLGTIGQKVFSIRRYHRRSFGGYRAVGRPPLQIPHLKTRIVPTIYHIDLYNESKMEVGGGAPPNGGGRGPDWPGVDQIGLIQAPARIEARGQRSPRHGLRNRERYGGNRVEDLAIPSMAVSCPDSQRLSWSRTFRW